MANIVSTVIVINKQWNHSSSVVKNGFLHINGRSASIFKTSTNYYMSS